MVRLKIGGMALVSIYWKKRNNIRKPLLNRILNSIEVEGDNSCWIWIKSRNNKGYGQIGVFGKTMSAHRLCYALVFGTFPKKLHVCHICDNPACINPFHLFLGTQSDNLKDAFRKGKMHPPINCLRNEKYAGSKITLSEVKEIRKAKGKTQRQLAAQYRISRNHVGAIRRGICWGED